MTSELPYRQIHMDFHTSPHIPAVGAKFDADEFGSVLVNAHVNSINLFAKCHHGYYYYPSKIGTMHPELKFDLLGAQIQACRERDIRVMAYTTAAWNEDWADRHPEWMQVNSDGVLGIKQPFTSDSHGWRYLCLNNPDHRDYLRTELREIQDNYQPDGFWIDIIIQRGCLCGHCLKSLREKGLEPVNQEHVKRHDRLVEIDFMRDIYGFIQQMPGQPDVYFNGHPAEMDLVDDREVSTAAKRRYVSIIDIESLPSDLWGYTHFPIFANYLNKYSQEITMMNGKFHKAWGDFGSLRNIEALEYECFRALANGAKCCVGDQLHPSGQIDKTVYNRIGEIYASVAEKEKWCHDTAKVAQIGALVANKALENQEQTNEGVYRILTEMHYQFDFIDFADDPGRYELVIIPDCVRLPEYYSRKLEEYLAGGGKILLSGSSGLNTEGTSFASERFGVEYSADCRYQPTYIRLQDNDFPNIPQMDYVMYERGLEIKALEGSRVLASQVDPYFNRSYERFCSHRQTPPSDNLSSPAIVAGESVIYISHPLFRDYAINGNQVFRQIVNSCISKLLDKPLVESTLPSTAEVNLRKHPRGYVLHILHYLPQRKSRTIDIIDAKIPLYKQKIKMRAGMDAKKVYCWPENRNLPFVRQDNMLVFEVPVINGHQMIIIETD